MGYDVYATGDDKIYIYIERKVIISRPQIPKCETK